MKIQDVLEQADVLFREGKREEAAAYLEKQCAEAREAGVWGAELAILNELMGYYRTRSEFEKAQEHMERLFVILRREELEGTIAAATSCMNAASLYRAMGNPARAMELYLQTEAVYKREGISGDRLAALYNNMCVASLDLEEPELAGLYGDNAVEAIENEKEAGRAKGIICGNIAGYYLKGGKERLAEAEEQLQEAEELFESCCPEDPHFSSVLAMKAYVQDLKGDSEGAVQLYRRAIDRTLKDYGKNRDFALLVENCAAVYEKAGKPEEGDKLFREYGVKRS